MKNLTITLCPSLYGFDKQLRQLAAIPIVIFIIVVLPCKLFAQAPTISYSGPQIYTAGTAIAPLTPTSTGVAAQAYSNNTVALGSGFNAPYSVAVDAAGNVYVSDSGNKQVKELPVGGGAPIVLGTFVSPAGIAVDATGNVYVADPGALNVVKIPAGGGSPIVLATGGTAAAVAVDLKGNVYVADGPSGDVFVIPANGGYFYPIGGGFVFPANIAVDAAGNVCVSDAGYSSIRMIPANGGIPVYLATGIKQPAGVAVDAAGNTYFEDAGTQTVYEVPAGGGAPVALATGFNQPFGLAIDGAGNLYVADHGSSTIDKLKPVGGYFIAPALPAGLNFNSVTGIISGTPTNASKATDYTITAYNSNGGSSATVNIKVNFIAPPAPAVSYNSPQVYTAGTAITPLAPTSSNVAAPGYSGFAKSVVNNFSSLTGIAVDAAGDIFAADAGANSIYEFPVSGTTITLATGLNSPQAIALDASGNIYVVDAGSLTVKKIPAGGGTPVTIITGLVNPGGLAVDPAGNVYVGDHGPEVIYKLNAGAGGKLVTFATFASPNGLATDAEGNLYDTDIVLFTNLIEFSPNGGQATLFSGFLNPQGVAVDAAGNVFMTDAGDNAVYEIAPGSSTLVKIGSGFGSPTGVAVDGAGKVYVADAAKESISIVVPVGGYCINKTLPAGLSLNATTGVISGTPTVKSPATDYTVSAYNTTNGGQALINIKVDLPSPPAISYSSPQTYSTTVTISPLAPVSNGVDAFGYNNAPVKIGAGFTQPQGVALNAAGTVLYVADYGHNQVKRVVLGGASPVIIGSGFNGPADVVLDAAGNIYVADSNNNMIKEIPVGGGAPIVLGSGFNNPNGIAIDAAGNIYVSDSGNNQVKEILAGGGKVVTLGSGFNFPAGIAVDATGNVFVSDGGNGSVKEIPLNGKPFVLSSAFISPTGLTIDAAGNLYVTDQYNNTLTEIPAGNGSPVTLVSGFNKPYNMAMDAEGDIYVAEINGNSVDKIVPSGGYFINPALPKGLTFSTSTGVVSGTPTKVSPATNYTVTAYNYGGSASAKVNIAVALNSAEYLSIKTNPDESTLVGVNGPGYLNYTEAVTNTTSSIQIIPTTKDPQATITVNGAGVISGSASASIPLAVGPNVITTIVTAPDGITTKSCIITIDRAAPSSDAEIISIKTNPYSTLIGTTGPGYLNYREGAAYSTSSIQVIPAAKEPLATITVNGSPVISGTASASIPLAVGANTITTVITAPDGVTTKSVILTVNRAASPPVNSVYQPISVTQPVDSLSIENDGIVVHQGVSPNGDGIDDFLVIDGINAYPDNKLTIINRNGVLVFDERGYNNSTKVFDGHSNKTGTMQVSGTYFYSLDYIVNGINKHKTGYIILKY